MAVWGTTLGGASYFFFAAVPIFLGFAASMIDPEMTKQLMANDSQLVLPNLVTKYMPFWVQVVFFGALLSVIMSTASGTLLAPSVTFAENIIRNRMSGMPDVVMLLVTRLTVLAFGLLVTLYAMFTSESIHGMVENAYRIPLAGAFVPLAAGLFWKKANNTGAALSISMGLGAWILLEIFGGNLNEIVQPHLIGFVASAIGMFVGSALLRSRA